MKLRNKELLEQGVFKLKSFGTVKYARVLGEVYVSLIMLYILTSVVDSDNSIDLSHDGWVSVNDILIEEVLFYNYDGGKKKNFKK